MTSRRIPRPYPIEAPAEPTFTSSTSARGRSPRALSIGAGLILALVASAHVLNPRLRAYSGTAISDLAESIRRRTLPRASPERLRMVEASELIFERRWDEALEIYRDLLEDRPGDPVRSYGLAICLHNLGRYDEAIEANLRAIDAPAYAPDAMFHLAGEYARISRFDDALDAFHQALRLGYRNFRRIAEDPALDPIRDDPRFIVPPEPERKRFQTRSGASIEYVLVLPEDFDPARTYPALLGFSRSRQQGNDVNFALDSYWGMQAHYHGWIVVSAIAPHPSGFAYADDLRLVPELLDDLEHRYRIEGGKFHLAGFSNGGTASFRFAIRHPHRFQSITAFPVYEISDDDLASLDVLDDMKISLFCGADDGGPSVETTDRIQRRLRELGIAFSLTVLADEGHICTSLMGNRFMKYLDSLRPSGAPWRMQRYFGE